MVEDNKPLRITAAAVAMGVRQGNSDCNQNTVDRNLIYGNTTATPVNIEARVVIVPVLTTPATIAAAAASAALMAKANFAPGANPAPSGAGELVEDGNFLADYQTAIITGGGAVLTVPLRPTEVLVVDTLGITVFNQPAEFELVWMMGHGFTQAPSLPEAPPNFSQIMIPARHGWSFGTASKPAELHGYSRLAPHEGPVYGRETTVVLHARHIGAENAGIYVPAPHYVEVALRGWKVVIGSDGRPMTNGVGGRVCDLNVTEGF